MPEDLVISYSNSDQRGRKLSEALGRAGLRNVMSGGPSPSRELSTFVGWGKGTIIDYIFISISLDSLVSHRVVHETTFSDHNPIEIALKDNVFPGVTPDPGLTGLTIKDRGLRVKWRNLPVAKVNKYVVTRNIAIILEPRIYHLP